MSEFGHFIEAAKEGALEDVRALIDSHPDFVDQRDVLGATALHHAAFGGHRSVVELLVQQGADINATDTRFGATPAGWTIEYLRELGGFLAIELNDFAYAIRQGDVDWVARFLKRFPHLRDASDTQGVPFKLLAEQSGNPSIVRLFTTDAPG